MAANARVSSFSRLLGKYYRSIPWAAIFPSREGRLFMTRNPLLRIHDYHEASSSVQPHWGRPTLLRLATILCHSQYSRFHEDNPWYPGVSRLDIDRRHSVCHSLSLTATLCHPPWERRDVERQRSKKGGKMARRRNCTMGNRREEARWEMAPLAELSTVCGISVFNRMRDRYATFPGRNHALRSIDIMSPWFCRETLNHSRTKAEDSRKKLSENSRRTLARARSYDCIFIVQSKY